MRQLIQNPFPVLMIAAFIALILFVIPLLFLGILGTAFEKLGFTWSQAILILVLTLLGSFVNIPIKTIQGHPVRIPEGVPTYYGAMYRIPRISASTVIAVNVGGALIPLAISLYLMFQSVKITGGISLLALCFLGICIVALVTNRVARPVPGLGIATPLFIPPLTALICALVLSAPFGGGIASPVIAYTSGTLGTLIGADLLNLRRIPQLGAPMASIGGAGTFDGVFLSGVLAAFIA